MLATELDSRFDTPVEEVGPSVPQDLETLVRETRHALANSNQVIIYLRQIISSHLGTINGLHTSLAESSFEIRTLRACLTSASKIQPIPCTCAQTSN